MANTPAGNPGTPAPAVAPAPADSKAPVSKDAPKVEPKRFKIGEEELSEQDIINWKQKATAADKKFQQAAELERKFDMPLKTAQAMVEALTKGDPTDLLSHPDIIKNPKLVEAMEKILWKRIQQQQMSPEQLELQKKLDRAAELERAEEGRKAQENKAKQDAANKAALQRLDSQITEILKSAKVPKTKYTVAQTARLMQAAANRKQAYNPQVIASAIEQLYYESNNYYADSLEDDEQLVKFLGPKTVERVRKYLVEKYNIKKKEKTTTIKPTVRKEAKEKRKLSWEDFMAQQKGQK